MLHCKHQGAQVKILNKNSSFFTEHICLANSVGPDKMPYNASFHVCFYCFPKCAFKIHYLYKEIMENATFSTPHAPS